MKRKLDYRIFLTNHHGGNMPYINKCGAALIILNFLLIFSNISAQAPATVLWQTDKDHVFSAEGIDFPTANMTLIIKDSSGQTVPEGTMIGILYSWADLQSPNRIYSYIDTSDYYGNYYFETDNQGRINIAYYPHYIPSYNKANTKNLNEYIQFYDLKNILSDKIYGAKLYGADISTIGIDWEHPISFESGSNAGILVGIDSVHITSIGRDGNNYIFAAPGRKTREEITMKLDFYDQFGDPVPGNIPVVMLTYWDRANDYTSPTLFFNLYGENYYCRTTASGSVEFKYTPTALGIRGSGSSYFYYGSWSYYKSHSGYTDSTEAWNQFKDYRTPKLAIAAVPFFYNGVPFSVYLNNFPYRANYCKIGGEKPFIIGPDIISIQTKGIMNGDNYLFTNPTIVEPAKIKMIQYDDLGRTVPEGTPILLASEYTYLAPEAGNGYLTGSRFENIDFPYGTYGFTDRNGVLEFIYTPPFAAPHALRPYASLLFNTAIEYINYNYPELPNITEGSTVPILVGLVPGGINTDDLAHADISFYPPQLTRGKISSKVKIKVWDQMGRPALRGSKIKLWVNKGTLDGAGSSVVRTLGKEGKVTVFYLSPTRNIGYDGSVTITVSGWGYDNYYDYGGDWRTINEKSMKMTGYAINPQDYSLSKFLFGKTFSDALSELNPLRALGSLKNLSKAAEIAREKRKRLYLLAGDPNATDEQIRVAEEEFQNAFAVVRGNIAQFIKDVPGTSFNPNLPQSGFGLYNSLLQNGLRRHMVSTISKHFTTEQVKQATIRYIETKLKIKIFPEALKEEGFQSSSAGNFLTGTYTGNFDVNFDGPFYIGESETRLHEAFGLKFKVSDFGDILFNQFNVGDQDLLPKEFIPTEVGDYISGGKLYESVGFFEVTSIDSLNQTIEFVAVGEIFPSPKNIPPIVTSITLKDTSNTSLDWIDGSGIEFSAGSVLDTANLFLAGIPVPQPTNVEDSLIIHTAYAFGRITPDSLIEPLNLLYPAKFNFSLLEINQDSLSKVTPIAYKFDEVNKIWIPLQIENSNSPDTMIFSVTGTGIYGIGWNPGAFISSVNYNIEEVSFQLNQNYPNPFNPSTTIEFTIPPMGTSEKNLQHVTLEIFDILGRKVRTLINEPLAAGNYRKEFNASDLTSGVYLYRLRAGNFIRTKKMVLIK